MALSLKKVTATARFSFTSEISQQRIFISLDVKHLFHPTLNYLTPRGKTVKPEWIPLGPSLVSAKYRVSAHNTI